jgi:hypothetical protein
MKTYEIKHEPININGEVIDKYNIYYYENDTLITKEYHSTDGINGEIKNGFVKK